MAKPKVHECTEHSIRLCPENKVAVLKKQAELSPFVGSSGISHTINVIISEWEEMKKASEYKSWMSKNRQV